MKRLLLPWLLIFDLAYSASGQAPENSLKIFIDKEQYAENLWQEVCSERIDWSTDWLEWNARRQLYRDRFEQMINLLKACNASSIIVR